MSNKSFVKKESKKDRFINIAVIGVFLVIVLSLLIIVSSSNKNKSLVDSHIVEVNYSEYKEKIKSDGYTIVLLAQPNCGHCKNYKPVVNMIALENDLTIYYLNVASRDLKEEEYYEIRNSVNATKDQVDPDGNPVIPTPGTVIYKNGVEVNSILGDIKYDGLINFLKNNGVIK